MSHKLCQPTERADLPKLPTTYLDFLDSLLRAYPIFARMIGDGATYNPEDVQTSSPPRDCSGLGKYFFPSAAPRETRKFVRTATALIAAKGLVEHDDALYRLITWSQAPDSRLTRDSFEELCYHLSAFADDPTFFGALKFYLILRGYARSPHGRTHLYAHSGLNFGPNDGMPVLVRLAKHHLIPDDEHLMPSQRDFIMGAVENDFPLISALSGEIPILAAEEYSLNRNTKSGLLAIAANLCELCATASHIKCHGLNFLREPLAEDCLTALVTTGNPIENILLASTSAYLAEAHDEGIVIAAERLSRMIGADSSFTPALIDYLSQERFKYASLIGELSLDIIDPLRGLDRDLPKYRFPITIYFGHNYLCGVYNLNAMKGVPDPLSATLDETLPCLMERLATLRATVTDGSDKPVRLVLNLAPDSQAAHRAVMRRMATVRSIIKED